MRILRSRAKTFVVSAWILFVVSIPICLLIGASAGFNQFYFPAHPQATFNAYDLRASRLVLASAAFAAALSSIALALKFRATASLSVILIWTTTIAGTQVARSFVKPGPDYFERHIGPEAFLVPWQYADSSPGVPPAKSQMRLASSSVSACSISRGGPMLIVATFNRSVFFQTRKPLLILFLIIAQVSVSNEPRPGP